MLIIQFLLITNKKTNSKTSTKYLQQNYTIHTHTQAAQKSVKIGPLI
jgi:hypothetical protein